MKLLFWFCAAAVMVAVPVCLEAADVTVDTTAMTIDGTTTSIAALQGAPGADGNISLAEAITAANNDAATEHTIMFDTTTFPPATPSIVTVNGTLLPVITQNSLRIIGSNAGVTIDGSQMTYRHGLVINAGDVKIRGLDINDFTNGIIVSGDNAQIGNEGVGERNVFLSGYAGVFVQGSGYATFENNYFNTNENWRTNWTGTIDVWISSTATDASNIGTTTAGNYFGPGLVNAYVLDGPANIYNNTFGTDDVHSQDISNAALPVLLASNVGGADTINVGGAAANQGNVLAYSAGDAISISSTNSDSTIVIAGNYIGTDSAWANLGNTAGTGIDCNTTCDLTIGGTTSAHANYMGYGALVIFEGFITVQNGSPIILVI